MAGKALRLVLIAVTVVLVGGVVVVISTTNITIDYSEPYVRIVSTALGAYNDIHGGFPATLLEIKPLIDGNAGIDCVIERTQDKRYLVIIHSASNGDHFVEVVYSVGADGTLEDYNARTIDGLPDK